MYLYKRVILKMQYFSQEFDKFLLRLSSITFIFVHLRHYLLRKITILLQQIILTVKIVSKNMVLLDLLLLN